MLSTDISAEIVANLKKKTKTKAKIKNSDISLTGSVCREVPRAPFEPCQYFPSLAASVPLWH